ncbi:hypothetical protein AURDEDRAFT_111380 [Auricularia subglabra TFB-10046 SS5]|nr:hypothetical protein AURDEDRAFT_111380 [Auricularia subglabra TFB-10046 SS5]
MSLPEEVETEDVKGFAPTEDTQIETEPDPDESLHLDQAHSMWMVKMPKFLLKRWTSVTEANIHLATIRVYDEVDPVTKTQRMEIILPDDPNEPDVEMTQSTLSTEPSSQQDEDTMDPAALYMKLTAELEAELQRAKEYELQMIDLNVNNQLVIAERDLTDPPSRTKATTRNGKIRHECNLQPIMNARYRRIIKERVRIANMSKRPIMRMEEVLETQAINRLASGVPSGPPVSSTWQPSRSQKPQARKGEFERFARMPRNELYDALFERFKEKPDWSLKELRARTQQPEAYLKEVLAEVATLHRSGEKVGLWTLKTNYSSSSTHADVKYEAGSTPQDGMDEDEDDDDDDDDEEDDMEEIS